MHKALFVDLANFYSSLLESGIDDPRILRDYFLNWFDFDRLAECLTEEFSPVWIFYSGRRIGPKPNRIEDPYLANFITRCNSLKGVTAYAVDIPGQQREIAKYECEKCGNVGTAQWESEKGVDTSLTVYMFDTAESWDTAYLISGDADYVPAVSSLRRRGKIVNGAGFGNPSSALVRECYYYEDLTKQFFQEDVLAYRIYGKDGLTQKWFQLDKKYQGSKPDNNSIVKLRVYAEYNGMSGTVGGDFHLLPFNKIQRQGPHYQVLFLAEGPLDLEGREKYITELKHYYSEFFFQIYGRNDDYIVISPLAWNGIQRRISTIIEANPDCRVENRENSILIFEQEYNVDIATGEFNRLEHKE